MDLLKDLMKLDVAVAGYRVLNGLDNADGLGVLYYI